MKKTLLAIVSVAALSAAAMPAAAQSYYRDGGHNLRSDINARQASLSTRIHRAEQTHRLSRGEAIRLRAMVRNSEVLERRFLANDGRISRREHDEIVGRLRDAERTLVAEMRDGNRRYGSGYGRW